MSVTAYIAMGSNLGDRKRNLDDGLAALRKQSGVRVGPISRYWETPPVGGPAGQGPYLNAAARIETDLAPRELLQVLLSIEQQLGRVREEHNGPRTLDMDILLFGERVIHEEGLTIPHPRMHERSFMLGPLAEIAPNVVHPVRKRTVAELLAQHFSPLLAGQKALVTGSSSGIGRGIAVAFARQGADVIVHARQSKERAQETARLVAANGVQCATLFADLRDGQECERLAVDAWEAFGRLDILVNNAGADILTGARLRNTFEEKLQELLAVDVSATILLSRRVGERMKGLGRGVILNMGWDQAETGMEGESGQLFGATKSAVMAFTKSLALSLAPEVRVNCLAPGWIRTAWGETASAAWQERAIKETPLGRWGTPDDVARAACWLASSEAQHITGQIIRINGGAVR